MMGVRVEKDSVVKAKGRIIEVQNSTDSDKLLNLGDIGDSEPSESFVIKAKGKIFINDVYSKISINDV